MENKKSMPVLFLGHGSPMNAIEENEFVEGFRALGKDIPKPRAIVCISAHWVTKGTLVTAMEQPPTIHDFGGFPQELYEVEYPASGSPALAKQIQSLVTKTTISLDMEWGLDHGAWSVIRHLYPAADVPVIQLSLDYYQSPQWHYELGKELRALRDDGVLIIGSGNIVHNLSLVDWSQLNTDDFGFDWAREVMTKVNGCILAGDHRALIDFESQGQAFELAIPTSEHYLPLLYVLSLQDSGEAVTFYNNKAVAGALSMTSVKIG